MRRRRHSGPSEPPIDPPAPDVPEDRARAEDWREYEALVEERELWEPAVDETEDDRPPPPDLGAIVLQREARRQQELIDSWVDSQLE